MAKGAAVTTTQRAYTLRLRGIDKNDTKWRDALWATHEAVNKGATVFGDWLLTLRGGLDHRLVDEPDKKGNPPSEEERRNRRILLALSWLSVESWHEPIPNTVAMGKEPKELRREKAIVALKAILAKRGMSESEITIWASDCQGSLEADIREDAVWVDRSLAFDEFCCRVGGPVDREYARRVVLGFLELKGSYFHIPSVSEDESPSQGGGRDEKPLVNEATGWLCDSWGAGKKTDKASISEILAKVAKIDFPQFIGKSSGLLLAEACRAAGNGPADGASADVLVAELVAHIGWQGRPSAARMALEAAAAVPIITEQLATRMGEKLRQESAAKLAESKIVVPSWMPAERGRLEAAIGLAYRDGKDRTFEFAVMLDHALRRVSGAHSWIKLAESKRRKFAEDAARLEAVPEPAREWLDRFCMERGGASGANDGYRIRKRATEGWEKIVTAWRTCADDAEARIESSRRVQAEWEDSDGKFGDVQLFEALAVGDAKCVWACGPKPLQDYVAATTARANQLRFKVPAYRHPDALRHPVFCDFGNSRWTIKFAVHERRKLNGKKARKGLDPQWLGDDAALALDLWTGSGISRIPMRWGCKRLVNDLALKGEAPGEGDPAVGVTRADRLGRAAAGAAGPVSILNVFDEGDWNGRLQAPRGDLERVAAYVKKHGWDSSAHQLLQRVRWLVSFSPKLQPLGPWHGFAQAQGLNPKYWPHSEANKKREGHARLMLSRLAGLRLLSVDLGHRFAAACAVWETIPAAQMIEECKAHGHPEPRSGDLFIHLKREGKGGIVYRRIGADQLPDGTPYPAPWARLERQFVIRLQGEGEARRATADERAAAERFEQEIGFRRGVDERMPSAVDELQFHAIRLARLGIGRHGRRAKIAWALTSDYSIGPGGTRKLFAEGSAEHAEHLARCLMDWHAMASESRWEDGQLRRLWNEHVAAMEPLLHIGGPAGVGGADAVGGSQREAERKRVEERIRSVIGRLDRSARQQIAGSITRRWSADDLRWQQNLSWLRRWLLPRGLKREKRRAQLARRVGGLSLTRIAGFKLLYQVQKAFFMRPGPDDPRKRIPALGDDSLRGFGQRVLQTMERLREQRVKQLASRIAEAALGIGAEDKTGPRPTSRVHEACHAIVVENLTNYRPDDLQTRRENRQLMDWSSAKVQKHLAEACELHGLHLREVSPSYTSRQASRTGLAGVRCQDVGVVTFLNAPHWRKRVRAAKERLGTQKASGLDVYLSELDDQLSKLPREGQKKLGPVRLPARGGDLFVAANGHVVQADLNAAANIGLRALLDPDFAGRWWYVPCNSARVPLPEKVKGSPLFTGQPLGPSGGAGTAADPAKSKKAKRAKQGEERTINLWRSVSASGPEEDGGWATFDRYWPAVEAEVVKVLREWNGKRLGTSQDPFDEAPF